MVDVGIEDILVIIGWNKNVIFNYFDLVFEFEVKLMEKGDIGCLEWVMKFSDFVDIYFVC